MKTRVTAGWLRWFVGLASALIAAALTAQPLLLDTAFPPGVGPSGGVNSIAVQSDGRVLIAGEFTNYNGTACGNLARVLADGTLDSTWQGSADGQVIRVEILTDGKVVISGGFTSVNGEAITNVARLEADGGVDHTFQLPGLHRNGRFTGLRRAPGGGLWLIGTFTNLNGLAITNLARLNSDGSVDTAFRPALPRVTLTDATSTPDGKVLVAGSFSSVGATPFPGLCRLEASGALDSAFHPAFEAGETVRRIVVEPDGSVVAALESNSTAASPLSLRLVRWTVDGSLEPSLASHLGKRELFLAPTVYDLARQPDGRFLLAGSFTVVNGLARNGIARVLADGSTDLCFDPGIGPTPALVRCLAPTSTGDLLVGGSFREVEGQAKPYFARLRGSSDCGPATIHFANSITRVSESSPVALVGIVRDHGALTPCRVRVSAEGVTATADVDYVEPVGELDFATAQRSATVKLPILYDSLTEGSESLRLRLVEVIGDGTLGTPAVHDITILDADPPGTAGSVDTNFIVALGQPVAALARLDDGRFLVATAPTNYSAPVAGVDRLLSTGAQDPAFVRTNAFDGEVDVLHLLPDGRTLVGGSFRHVNGVFGPGLARLNADGSIDPAFAPFAGWPENATALPQVFAIRTLSDGSWFCGGSIGLTGSESVSRAWVRITANGQADTSISESAPMYSYATAMADSPIGGFWVCMPGWGTGVGLVNENGALDPGVIPPGDLRLGVAALVADDQMLAVGGSPASVLLNTRQLLYRLNPDGSEMLGFSPAFLTAQFSYSSARVMALAGQPDGRLVAAGDFRAAGGSAAAGLMRLHPDGSLDLGFDPGAGFAARVEGSGSASWEVTPEPRVLLPLPEGGWLVGGEFGGYDGFRQPYLVKVLPETLGRPLEFRLVLASNVVSESTGLLDVSVRRTGDAIAAASVRISTVADTAEDGSDFAGTNVVIQFNAGEWQRAIAIPVLGDTAVESSELFAVGLSDATGGFTVAGTNEMITIVDDDVNVEFTADEFAGEEAEGFALVSLRRWGVPGDTPAFSLHAGTQQTRIELGAATSTNFTKVVRVPIPDDTLKEGTEAVSLRLTNPEGGLAFGTRSQAALMVEDNDYLTTPGRGVAGVIHTLARGSNDTLYVGGYFTGIHGTARRSVARLLANGEVDPTFDPGVGPDGEVWALGVAPDGSVAIGGNFTTVAGTARPGIARLLPGGALDTTFDPGSGPTGGASTPVIRAMTVQTDGRVLVGGSFWRFDGRLTPMLVRLNLDGGLDAGFNPPMLTNDSGLNGPPGFTASPTPGVYDVGVQSDGSVVVVGELVYLESLNQPWYAHLLRLSSSGEVVASDASTNLVDSTLHVVAILKDDRILAGGSTSFRLSPPVAIVRRYSADLIPDASYKVTFPPGSFTSANVRHLLPLEDGRVIAAADVTVRSGPTSVQETVVGRLLSDGLVDPSFVQVRAVLVGAPADGYTNAGSWATSESSLFRRSAIRALAYIPGGVVTIGGAFREIGGQPRHGLARLDLDGSLRGVPRLDAYRSPVADTIHIAMPAEVEIPYRLERSTNLRDWAGVVTNTWPWDAMDWVELEPSTGAGLFRAVEVP